MKFQYIDQSNFSLYCARMYDNPQCASVEEYDNDLEKMDIIKKLLCKLTQNKTKVNLRLLINHVIVFNNLFGNVPGCRILMLFCPEYTHSNLVTLLSWLNVLPEEIPEFVLNDIEINNKLLERLEEL